MKKILPISFYSLFALTIFYPVCSLVADIFGYTFEVGSTSVYAVSLSIVSLCTVIFDICFKTPIQRKLIRILIAILPFAAFINATYFILFHRSILVAACLIVFVICCCILWAKHRKTVAGIIVASLLSAFAIWYFGILCFIGLTLGNIGQNTVVKTVDSPNGTQYAEVIDIDQGALGGDTLVVVRQKRKIDLILFIIEKEPQRVYLGRWGEFENMKVSWRDDHCLIINSVEYAVE